MSTDQERPAGHGSPRIPVSKSGDRRCSLWPPKSHPVLSFQSLRQRPQGCRCCQEPGLGNGARLTHPGAVPATRLPGPQPADSDGTGPIPDPRAGPVLGLSGLAASPPLGDLALRGHQPIPPRPVPHPPAPGHVFCTAARDLQHADGHRSRAPALPCHHLWEQLLQWGSCIPRRLF